MQAIFNISPQRKIVLLTPKKYATWPLDNVCAILWSDKCMFLSHCVGDSQIRYLDIGPSVKRIGRMDDSTSAGSRGERRDREVQESGGRDREVAGRAVTRRCQ